MVLREIVLRCDLIVGQRNEKMIGRETLQGCAQDDLAPRMIINFYEFAITKRLNVN
jgi:hypothetical protein